MCVKLPKHTKLAHIPFIIFASQRYEESAINLVWKRKKNPGFFQSCRVETSFKESIINGTLLQSTGTLDATSLKTFKTSIYSTYLLAGPELTSRVWTTPSILWSMVLILLKSLAAPLLCRRSPRPLLAACSASSSAQAAF